jgi:16S rRNA processing protein RimM
MVERLSVGYVAGAHGLAGGLHVQLHDARSEAVRVDVELCLVRDARVQGQHRITRADPVPGKPGRWRVQLEGVDDRDAAEAYKGAQVEVARDALAPLADDEFYLADVIGHEVRRVDAPDDEPGLGTIVGVMSNGPQDLFEVQVRGPTGRPLTWLLPVVPAMIKDVDDRCVRVDLPRGLLPEELEG